MGDSNFDTVVAALTGDVTGSVTYTTVSRTATSTGATTGTIADAGLVQFVTVAATAATQIVILPTPTPGTLILLQSPASTAFELRSSAPQTVGINGGAATNAESAIPANTAAQLICTSATNWAGWQLAAGTTFGAVEAAA